MKLTGGSISVTGASTSKLRLLLNFVVSADARQIGSLDSQHLSEGHDQTKRTENGCKRCGTWHRQCWKIWYVFYLLLYTIKYIHKMHLIFFSHLLSLFNILPYKQMLIQVCFVALIVRFLTRRFIGEYGEIGMLPYSLIHYL